MPVALDVLGCKVDSQIERAEARPVQSSPEGTNLEAAQSAETAASGITDELAKLRVSLQHITASHGALPETMEIS